MKQSSESLLALQFSQLSNLLTLLTQEKEVLQKNSPDDLIKLTQEKNTLLLSIQDTDNQISLQPNFATEKSEGLHQESLESISNLLAECKDLNTLNGMIIQQSQAVVARMKTSLLESGSQSSSTYDKKGNSSGSLKGLKSLNIKA